jgi:predicted secreted protein
VEWAKPVAVRSMEGLGVGVLRTRSRAQERRSLSRSSGALPKMRVGPSEPALQERASNHLKLLRSKAVVVSVEAKGAPLSASGVVREDERK